jgi:putative ABC transport system permease protein
VDGVKVVSGIVSGSAELGYLSQTARVSVEGVDPLAWAEISSVEMDSGRTLTPGDGNMVVVGYRIANEMFKQPLVINTQVTREGKSFKIVGILEESGTNGFGSNDNRVFMTIGAARGVLEDIDSDELTSIQVKVDDAGEMDPVIGNITNALMLSRHVTEKTVDFSVTSSQSMQATISDVTGTMTLFLGGIAAVSLIVGAIGIANTMFMSVMERTRQIGTLKALGATDGEIMKLFLFESGIIGLVGGLFGIFLGFIFSGILSGSGISIMGMGRFGGGSTTVIGLDLVLFAVGFSVVIGILSGILPARRAAKLQPVEALRYE